MIKSDFLQCGVHCLCMWHITRSLEHREALGRYCKGPDTVAGNVGTHDRPV